MPFSKLGLSQHLVQATKKAKYSAPYPIQKQAIPIVLEGKDLLALAETGSGKTASYILPILESLIDKSPKRDRNIAVLILVPTRELAAQVEESVRVLSEFLPRRIQCKAVFGGVSINPQMLHMIGTEILVATPGRLLDLVSKNALSLKEVKTLVLDEADQVLNKGFKEEVDSILSLLPSKRQNILFSATTNESVDRLINKLLNKPVKIELQSETITPDLIEQLAYLITNENKGPFLRYLIKTEKWKQALVFTSSTRSADNLVNKLEKNGIRALALHSKKSQGARTNALTQFKAGKLQVLVATDLASRGIDIVELPYVVNYELPRSPNDYIHRIGRTGRANVNGKAISLICPEDEHHFKIIQKKMKKEVETIDGNNIELT